MKVRFFSLVEKVIKSMKRKKNLERLKKPSVKYYKLIILIR